MMNNNRFCMGLRQIRLFVWIAFLFLYSSLFSQTDSGVIETSSFLLHTNRYGISSLSLKPDTFPTNYIGKGKKWGEWVVRYAKHNVIDSVYTSDGTALFCKNHKEVRIWKSQSQPKDLLIHRRFDLGEDALVWTIDLQNHSGENLIVTDIALPLFYNNDEVEDSKEIFEQRVIEHQFISGNNSFLFWQRPSGVPPYLVMIPLPQTSLEYFKTESFQGSEPVYQAFIHSAHTGNGQTRCR